MREFLECTVKEAMEHHKNGIELLVYGREWGVKAPGAIVKPDVKWDFEEGGWSYKVSLSNIVKQLKEENDALTCDRDMWKNRALELDGKYQNWIE